jgi:hypothetical protein
MEEILKFEAILAHNFGKTRQESDTQFITDETV